jgi:hypothetical protein
MNQGALMAQLKTLSNHRRGRRGSALLVCTLAAAVLSMAAIAIIRSSQRNIARVDALRTTGEGRFVVEGLFQRSIAVLRSDPNSTGPIVDPANGMPGATCVLRQLSPTATQVQIFLYTGATTPAKDVVLDPTAL